VANEEGFLGTDPEPVVVGATMRKRVDHPLQVALLTLSPKPSDATHG
jgi:hypothetical protein